MSLPAKNDAPTQARESMHASWLCRLFPTNWGLTRHANRPSSNVAVLQAHSDVSFEESSAVFSSSELRRSEFYPVTVLLREALFETYQAH